MKMKKDKWKLDETSKHFIRVKLADNQGKILALRHRWKIDDEIPGSPAGLPAWREKIERECQNLRREIRVSEVEDYFEVPDALLPYPILSSEVEGRLREENWGDSLESAFKLEIRALGAELKFPSAWDLILRYYLLFNDENFELIFNHGITLSVRYKINEEYGQIGENVCLTLSENTASPDLDNFWNNQVKPLLNNLEARTKGRLRGSKNSSILEELVERGAMKRGWQQTEKNEATSEIIRDTDADIAIAKMSDKEADRATRSNTLKQEKKVRKILARRVQGVRNYRKKHPIP